MTEKDLIQTIQGLRSIKPNQEWVSLTKKRVFSLEQEEPKMDFVLFTPFFRYKLAFAPMVAVLAVIGLLGFAQNTAPGDFFFQFKKATETAQVGLSSGVEKPGLYVKLANKRLEELNRIAETSQGKNLSQAIQEFQANITEAAKTLATMDASVPSSDQTALKDIVAEAKKLEANKQKAETALGAKIGDTEEFDNALLQIEKQTAGYLIADLKERTLSEEDQKLLDEAKASFQEGNYSQALEKIWFLSNK